MAEITRAQLNRYGQKAKYEAFRNYLNFAIAGVEAYGWSSFGTGIAQIVFAVWAILMVLMRSHLSEIKVLALKHGNTKLANNASGALLLGICITAFSIFTVYSDEMHRSDLERIAQSAPVRLAAAELKSLQIEAAQLEKKSDPQQIEAARSQSRSLQKELKLVQQPIEGFWQNRHKNGELYLDIVDKNTLSAKSSRWGGGLMITARNSIVEQWNVLLSRELKIQNQLDQLASILKIASNLDVVNQKIRETEQKLLSSQTSTGINLNDIQTHHPVFHRLSQLIYGLINPDNMVTLFGLVVIFLALFVGNILSEGIVIAPNVPDSSNAASEPNNKGSWFNSNGFLNSVLGKFLPQKTSAIPNNATAKTTITTTCQVNNNEGSKRLESIGFIQPLQEQGRESPKRKPKSEVIEEVRVLLSKKMSVADIAKEVGLSKSTIYNYRKKIINC